MDLLLKDKNVLVMAASKGIGKGIAKKYSEEGANVVITGRNKNTLEETAKDISNQTGNKVYSFPTDVAKADELDSLFNYLEKEFGTIDVIISNAGGPPIINFEESDEGIWYDAFELTVMSTVRTLKRLLPLMRANKGGRVIYIASSSVKEPISELLLSNVFRSAVQALCKSLAQDYAKDQILINIVGPAKVNTERLENIDKSNAKKNNMDFKEWQDRVQSTIPIGRYASTSEFSDAVLFLGSYRNTYITGQTLLIDGGMVKSY